MCFTGRRFGSRAVLCGFWAGEAVTASAYVFGGERESCVDEGDGEGASGVGDEVGGGM